MKDGNDTSTTELISLTSAPAIGAINDPLFVARQRARLLQDSWLPVSMVAKDWGVTSRRVRVLLDGGRLHGRKQDNGYWEVKFPYSITAGTRGPASRREFKKVERMQERQK